MKSVSSGDEPLTLAVGVHEEGFEDVVVFDTTSGTQHNRFVGFAAEGGLGKVLAELGLPGIAILLWFALAFLKAAFAAVAEADAARPGSTDVATGVLAFCGGNVAVFAIAHQVFGDPFVLTILGVLVGALLRLPFVASSEEAEPTTAEAPLEVGDILREAQT